MTLLRPLCAAAALAFLAGTAAAQANDECTGAIPVTLGTTFFDTSGSTTSTPAFDCETNYSADIWYLFNAPQSGFYEFSICSANYDSVIEVADGACGSLSVLGCRDDACGLQSTTTVMCMAGQDYYVRIGGWGSSQGSGDLEITQVVQNDLELVAHYRLDDTSVDAVDSSGNNLDGFYQATNQGVPGAAPGTNLAADFDGSTSYVEIFAGGSTLSGLQNDLSVSAWINVDALPADTNQFTQVWRVFSNDGPTGSWSVGVNEFGGITLTTHGVLDYDQPATITPGQWHHIVAVMDIFNDVTFYLDGAAIGTIVGANPANTAEDLWFIGAWDPNFSIPQFFDGRIDDVQVYAGALEASDVTTLFSNPGVTVGSGGTIGTPFCQANPNSTGVPGTVSADGSVIATDNDMTLTASSLPPGQFGIFVTSQTTGPATTVLDGNLCLSGIIGRYDDAGQILQADANGQLSLALDLTQTPTTGANVAVMAGETWSYQFWYRDAGTGGPTANLTSGLSIQYQ